MENKNLNCETDMSGKDENLQSEEATNLQQEDVNESEEINNADKVTADDDWKAKYESLNDSHLRLMAEYDNYRKRTLREKADLIKSGGESALSNLLPVIDDFERALQTIRNVQDVKAMEEGVELIYNKFTSYLNQQGVKAIDAVGKPFDTELFEAVATIPAPEEDLKGKVLDCIQTGYTLYDKVIRHAKVVVGE